MDLKSRICFEIKAAPSCAHYNDSTVYLQRGDVRRALNIPDIVPQYESCNNDIANQYDMKETHYISQSENVKKVIQAGYKAALFYGDVDSVCNAVHGSQFAYNLGLKLISPLRPYLDNEQKPPTIGFVSNYEAFISRYIQLYHPRMDLIRRTIAHRSSLRFLLNAASK
ncbi:hypothetical protein ANCDUO_05747 [Ancylostoma duodenale]|uniref:Uncharacterized protein n=1 Tax=Ancylostoma duodenale TaxID=51022 RepID=A0A0C2GRN3_9BILA|nr:hypothetical protein ANCDUO_05747 [Ancylostoma duodenale]